MIGNVFTKTFTQDLWFMASNGIRVGKAGGASIEPNCQTANGLPRKAVYTVVAGYEFINAADELKIGGYANYTVGVEDVYDTKAELIASLTPTV